MVLPSLILMVICRFFYARCNLFLSLCHNHLNCIEYKHAFFKNIKLVRNYLFGEILELNNAWRFMMYVNQKLFE